MYLVVLHHGEDEAAGGELPQDGDLGGRHVPQLVVLRLLRRTQNTDNTQLLTILWCGQTGKLFATLATIISVIIQMSTV